MPELFPRLLLTQVILPVDAMRPQARTLMLFSLLVGALHPLVGDLLQASLTVGVEHLMVEDLCHFLPVGAMRPHAEIAVLSPLLVGAMLPHVGGRTALTRPRARSHFSLRVLSLHLSLRRLESGDVMNMTSCQGQDRMSSLVAKVEFRAQLEMGPSESPPDPRPSGTVVRPLRDHQEVVRLEGIGMIHPMVVILVPQVPRPPLEVEGEEARRWR